MEYNQFLEEVKECVAYKVGEQCKVQINHVIKNNEVELDGIVIFEEGEKLSPNIYLNSYYDKKMKGESIETIAEEILHIYYVARNENHMEEYEVQFSFEELKSSIIYRLVNYKKNRKMLEETPHIRFLDLAITFHCLVKQDTDGIGTIRITNDLMKQWNVSMKKLLKLASSNTSDLFPVKIRTMDEVIREILTKEMEELFDKYDCAQLAVSNSMDQSKQQIINSFLLELEKEQKMPMYIMTNTQGINGASTLLYQDILKSFADQIQSDFYVLPSSIHEVILVPFQTHLNKENLRGMVCDVNQTQVPLDEILSDQVYIYRREKNAFEL